MSGHSRSSRSLPSAPAGLPLIGHSVPFARDSFGFIDTAAAACGDVFRFRLLGAGEFVVLAHPDYFKRVLIEERASFGKSGDFEIAFGEGIIGTEGPQWRRQRAAMGEFFTPERVREYASTMATCIDRRVERWQPSTTLSLADEMHALALEILFATIFDRPLALEGDEALRSAADALNEWFRPTSWVLPPSIPTPARHRFHRAVDTLQAEATRLLAERRDAPPSSGLLAALAASDLEQSEAIDQVTGMIFAGHETTANTLIFAWQLLGTHPEVERRFHAELTDVLGDRQPTLETISQLEFTDRIISETMRLYPPVHTLPRETRRDVQFDDYHVPAGSDLHLSLRLVHRDDRFYDSPTEFRPDRWLEWDGPDFAYAPFGGGPRICLGRRFAELEAKLVLATIGQQYRLEPQAALELDPQMTTRAAGRVPVRVRERET